jgi:hypothetical protein
MSKAVADAPVGAAWLPYGEQPERKRTRLLAGCRELAEAIYPGLDLSGEIRAVQAQGLGETVLLEGAGRLDGFAVCHCGPGTEAGGGACYVKFGAVRPGTGAEQAFGRLLQACEALAAARRLSRLVAGVNTARLATYRQMLASGFRADFVGVAMEQSDEPGYNRPDVYLIDDWR